MVEFCREHVGIFQIINWISINLLKSWVNTVFVSVSSFLINFIDILRYILNIHFVNPWWVAHGLMRWCLIGLLCHLWWLLNYPFHIQWSLNYFRLLQHVIGQQLCSILILLFNTFWIIHHWVVFLCRFLQLRLIGLIFLFVWWLWENGFTLHHRKNVSWRVIFR